MDFRDEPLHSLNADYSFLNLVNWKRAVCLLAKARLEVVKDSGASVLSSGGRVHRLPAVLRLIKLIRTIYRAGVTFSKRNVFVRDGSGAPTAASGATGFRSTISSPGPGRADHF